MHWLTTFSLVIRSNVTALIERFEDPERVLNQLLIDMEEELERVRASTAGVIADEIQIGKDAACAREEAARWQQHAEAALRRGDEAQTHAALEQKVAADRRAEALGQQHQRHQAEAAKVHQAVRDLEEKIRQANHRRALLLARLTRADSAQQIRCVLKQVEDRSALAQFQRLESRVERAEALEEAYDRLDGRDPAAEQLQRQLEKQEARERLQRELDELKRRVQPGAQ
jgi:phage shock protein A